MEKLKLKIFKGFDLQKIEEEFNLWSKSASPFVIKSIMQTAAIQKPEGEPSLFSTMAVFYTSNNHGETEELPQDWRGKR